MRGGGEDGRFEERVSEEITVDERGKKKYGVECESMDENRTE
jgi:hypothetical protein